MNDFFLANNRNIAIGDITVHQLQMYDFDEWAPHAKVIKDFLKNHSDEIYKSLFEAHTTDVMIVVSKSTHKSIDELIVVVEASEIAFIELIDAAIKVNDVFFSEKETKRKRGRKKAEEQSSWFDTFQFLIDAGHRHDDILQMSYGTFIGYLKSAQKQQSDKLRTLTNLMRAANHANAKAFAKLIEELKPSDD